MNGSPWRHIDYRGGHRQSGAAQHLGSGSNLLGAAKGLDLLVKRRHPAHRDQKKIVTCRASKRRSVNTSQDPDDHARADSRKHAVVSRLTLSHAYKELTFTAASSRVSRTAQNIPS
jgi:hypothetical protein